MESCCYVHVLKLTCLMSVCGINGFCPFFCKNALMLSRICTSRGPDLWFKVEKVLKVYWVYAFVFIGCELQSGF